MTALDSFVAAQAQFNTAFSQAAVNGAQLYRWAGGRQKIPMYIRSAEFNCGMPSDRKFFEAILFHGDGTAQIRVYVDGAFSSQATLTSAEGSAIPRRINLPTGSRGYGLSFELVGPYNLRAIELEFRPVSNNPTG